MNEQQLLVDLLPTGEAGVVQFYYWDTSMVGYWLHRWREAVAARKLVAWVAVASVEVSV